MAETSMSSGMAEIDIEAMKETLHTQQQLLQNLYAELDQEREASSTAASEALDMILRLQGEKAAVKMEASQYKRMAEEKIGHVETTLEIFEELMDQKEMEIASLEFQVQAYKHKLLSMGCDLNASEFEFPENLLSKISDQQNEENDQSGTMRRLNSLPLIPLKNSLRATRKMERSLSLIPEVIPKIVEQITDQEVTSQSLDLGSKSGDLAYGNLNSYWNQIKRLDEKVKVISDFKEFEGEKCAILESRRWKSCSEFSQASNIITSDQTDRLPSRQDREAANPSSLVNVHDVFEVPQPRENRKVSESWKKILEKVKLEAENRLTKSESVSKGMIESHVKHKQEKLMSMVSTSNDIQITSPKDMMTIIGQKKEGMSVNWNAQAECQKLYQRIVQLERERISIRQEIKPERDGEEQLRLLKDIHSQLKSMQSEMRSWKTKKTKPKDDVPLGALQEAMLSFWI